jgi:hypothetical protein
MIVLLLFLQKQNLANAIYRMVSMGLHEFGFFANEGEPQKFKKQIVRFYSVPVQNHSLLLMMMSFICSCRNKNQPKVIYPKGTSYHTRLFRGPSTNGMKK